MMIIPHFYGFSAPYMYKTTVIHRPGWSDKAIELFLDPPDKKKGSIFGKKNKKGGGGSRKLYLRERVFAIECSVEFKEFVRKNQRRVEAGKRIQSNML